MAEETKQTSTAHRSGFSQKWRGSFDGVKVAYRVGFMLLIVLSVLLAGVLCIAPLKLQLTLLLVFPALIGFLFIIRNPYLGVLAYFAIQFMRPQEFIPALRPLRLGMVVGVVALVSWIFNVILNQRKLYWPTFNWIFVGFLGVIGVTIFTAMNNRMAYDIFHMMVVFFITYLIATNVSTTVKHITTLIWLLLVIHFYFAIEGIQGGGRVRTSLMGDENDFALALNTMIPFAFFYYEHAKKKMVKYFSLIILGTFSLGVVSSMSRGGWVGYVAVMFFCIMQSKRKVMSLAIAGLLGVVLISFAPGEYWNEISTISDTSEATAATRLNYWKAAGRMFIDYPLFGVGANNGGFRMPEYVTGFRDARTQWGRTFHGTLPQILAELGGLGLAFYLAMIAYTLSKLKKIRKRHDPSGNDSYKMLSNSIIGGMIGYLVSATFLSTTYYPQIWTMFTLMVMLMFHLTVADAEKPQPLPVTEVDDIPVKNES